MSNFKLRISVKGLFLNKDGQLLLVKSNGKGGEDFWCAPGGGLEAGEKIFEAVERELYEETGYFGRAKDLIFAQDLTFSNGDRQIELFFRGVIDESRQNVPSPEGRDCCFVSREEFAKIDFLPKELDPFSDKSIDFAEHG